MKKLKEKLFDIEWDDRKELVEGKVKRKKVGTCTREKAVEFCELLALGHNHKPALQQLDLVWSDFADFYHIDQSGVLWSLYQRSRELGETLRQQLREDEADRRALEGVKKGVFHKGKKCGDQTVYSDSLLALQLKAGNPEKYADRQRVEHKGVVLNLEVQGVERGESD